MSEIDRRAFVGAAAVGCVAAAVLAASSAEAAGQSGYFVIAEIVSKKDKAALDAHMVTPDMNAIAPKLGPVLAKPFTQLFLNARTAG